jgi:hypothetical protein
MALPFYIFKAKNPEKILQETNKIQIKIFCHHPKTNSAKHLIISVVSISSSYEEIQILVNK